MITVGDLSGHCNVLGHRSVITVGDLSGHCKVLEHRSAITVGDLSGHCDVLGHRSVITVGDLSGHCKVGERGMERERRAGVFVSVGCLIIYLDFFFFKCTFSLII